MSRDAVKFGRMSKKQRDRLHAEVQQQLQQRVAEGTPGVTPGVTGTRGHPLTPASTPGCPGTRHGGMDERTGPAVQPEGTRRGPDGDGDGDGPNFYPHPGASSVLESPVSPSAEIEQLTQNVLASHRATCQPGAEDLRLRRGDTFTREEVSAYQRQVRRAPGGDTGVSPEATEATGTRWGHGGDTRVAQPAAEMWQRCAGRITEAVQHVVEFAKRLRGFMELSQHDQIVLLKAGAMEVVLVRMCRAFDAETRTVFFEGKYAGAELFRALGCQELVGSIFDFAQSLSALRFSESEVAFVSALVLVNASRPWLQEQGKVARLQGHLDVAFRLLLRRTQREGLLARLPPRGRLRALCWQHIQQLGTFLRQHPGVSPAAFPPLYRELFVPDVDTGATR
ncbi:nuclear receptor ROR-gamma [Caloenas nicobarica]|uniref:nuclear receptor ROR-gamma n=1 Tax=Caloenas nicobarica TaxID=187106 RepID=UPI0032B83D53